MNNDIARSLLPAKPWDRATATIAPPWEEATMCHSQHTILQARAIALAVRAAFARISGAKGGGQ